MLENKRTQIIKKIIKLLKNLKLISIQFKRKKWSVKKYGEKCVMI